MSFRCRGLIALVALAALSCSSSVPRFLLFLDPYSAELQPGLATELEPEFRAAEVVRPLGEDAERELRALLVSRRPAVVLVSPLFDLDLDRLAAEFPGSRFVRAESAPGAPAAAAAEWLHLQFDYLEAMREAGRLAARLAENPALSDRLGGNTAGRTGVGILVSEVTPRLQERIAAFRAGFAEVRGSDQLLYRQVDSANDRVKARRLLEEMREEGAGVFLLLTYSLTGFCLEYLGKQGALAVAQGPAAAAAYPEVVAAYFEEDTAAALRELRGLAREGPLPQWLSSSGVMPAAVRLRTTAEGGGR